MKSFLKGWFLPFVLSLLASLILYTVFRSNFCVVRGNSMSPTLNDGQKIWVSKYSKPSKGDIMLVISPYQKNKRMPRPSLVRCVALPGDTVSIVDKKLIVNSVVQKDEFCTYDRNVFLVNEEERKLASDTYHIISKYDTGMMHIVPISEFVLKRINADGMLKHISNNVISKDLGDKCLYPFSTFLQWNKDNYGPIVVPKRGYTFKINSYNIVCYRELLEKFENVKFVQKNGHFYLNGELIRSYTFKRDYYFLLNDYRDDPSDSRTFGPVPQDIMIAKYNRVVWTW